MYKFKKSLGALIGLGFLVTIVTVVLPHTSYGSGGTSAPTPSTQNVKVVNTGSEPVPIQGTATVNGTVQAQQNGVWNVGINGTPVVGLDAANNTVKFDAVNNTVKIDPASPVPVRDVDNPARQPFAAACTIANNNGFPCAVTTVPPGKRLVIEMFQLQAANGILPELIVVTNNTGITYRFFEPSQLVRVYADPGSTVQAQGGPLGTVAAISGYLVDLP